MMVKEFGDEYEVYSALTASYSWRVVDKTCRLTACEPFEGILS
jgi:hypothetical protein